MKDFKEILEFIYTIKDDFYIEDIRLGLALSESDFGANGFGVDTDTVMFWEESKYKLSDLSNSERTQFKQFIFGLENFIYKMIYGDDSDEVARIFAQM